MMITGTMLFLLGVCFGAVVGGIASALLNIRHNRDRIYLIKDWKGNVSTEQAYCVSKSTKLDGYCVLRPIQ